MAFICCPSLHSKQMSYHLASHSKDLRFLPIQASYQLQCSKETLQTFIRFVDDSFGAVRLFQSQALMKD